MNQGRATHLSMKSRGAMSQRAVRGFSLIEALVALLIVSLGMLAIAGFQANLAGASDIAKQRMEAVRLAQDKMEAFRSFGNLTGYSSIANGSDGPFVSNAQFTRTWTVSQGPSDTERWINIIVSWTDRRGNAQQVTTQSSIAKFDPQDIGTLATGPGGITVRKPKNRSLNIPYPAVTLSGGAQSAFIPPPGNVVYVFNNTSGNIEKSCEARVRAVTLSSAGTAVTALSTGHPYTVAKQVTISGASVPAYNGTFTITGVAGASFTYAIASPTTAIAIAGTASLVPSLTEGLDLSASALDLVCNDFSTAPKYLLSGYVRFDTGNNPTGAIPGTLGNNNNTLPLSTALQPLTLDTSNRATGFIGDPSMTCFSQRQVILQASSTALKTISSLSVNSSTGVVTISATAHGFTTGQSVAINGFVNNSSATAVLGAFTITVVDANTFSYTIPTPGPLVTLTSGTSQLTPRVTVADNGTTPTGYSNSPIDKFISYACVVTPVNHDNSDTTAFRWWGQVLLATDGSWTIGTASGDRKVCRYSADFNGNNAAYVSSTNTGTPMSNSEHPSWYRGVTGALDSQNYLVIDQGSNCPTDKAANPLGSPATYADNTTASHQPLSIATLSFQCLTAGCSGSNKVTIEREDTTTDLSMD